MNGNSPEDGSTPLNHVRQSARPGAWIAVAWLRVVLVFSAIIIYLAMVTGLLSNTQTLTLQTLLLLLYVSLEIRRLWARNGRAFLINPVVLASIVTIAIPYGITNIAFALPERIVAQVGLHTAVDVWINQLMLLVLLGTCSMLVGYDSASGRKLGLMLRRSRALRKWLSSSSRIRTSTLYAFLTISVVARLWAIKLGVYGYSSGQERLLEGAAYREYLSIAQSLGTLALVGLALLCFATPRPPLWHRLLLALTLGYEVLFGLLSGFKSAVVFPIIIVGIVSYSQRNRVSRKLLLAAVIALIAAYGVIEPFRAARQQNPSFVETSIQRIVGTMATATLSGGAEGTPSTWLRVLASSNLTLAGSHGIEYAALGELPPGSPDFLSNIILAPAYAFLPRFVWATKPLQNIGLWYTNRVIGHEFNSSTAMGPITYLNFAGGPLAVILGFLIVGILQRGIYDGLRGFGVGGLIVFFGLLGTLARIDSAFYTFFVALIRLTVLLVLAQKLLLQPRRR